jgi:hypothetical protein
MRVFVPAAICVAATLVASLGIAQISPSFLAIGSDGKLIVADVLNWRFQVFVPIKASGKLSEYVPTERKFFGFKPSDGYVFRSPGWPTK